jgi:CheY-like chemotaxis protein
MESAMVKNQISTRKTKKILIIDDEPQFCEDLAFLLGGFYETVIAAGSQEGMRFVKEIKPDLIILDLVMPAHFAKDRENEGIEVLKRLKRITPSKIPVLILTKMDSDEKRTECTAIGAEGFLRKPPLIKELVGEIEKIIDV